MSQPASTDSNLSTEDRSPARECARRLSKEIPEAFSEGRLDVEALRRALGEEAFGAANERYALNWAGKKDAYRVLQTPSVATLRPDPAGSLDFDTAPHVFIEGENLEVLKVLQRAYFGKVKLIYIDPPYNTGSDSFIYPDRFQESREEYLRRVDELDDDGTLTREGFFRKNSRDSGRFHSNWLSMMLPRLYLARNLLRDDGVIFASCDDNEVHNLRHLMDEVFGEDCFAGQIPVINNLKGRNDRKYIATTHEYVLMYAKPEFESLGLPLTSRQVAEYRHEDEEGQRFTWRDLRKRGGADTRERRPRLYYPIFVNPNDGSCSLDPSETHTVEVLPKKSDDTEGCWRWGVSKVRANLSDLRATKVEGKERWNVSYRVYLEPDGRIRVSKPKSVWMGPDLSTDAATRTLKALIPEVTDFTPKPVELLKTIILQSMEDDDLALDFFAGSCTFAHALLELNHQLGTQRQFICVQYPEPIAPDSSLGRAGFGTLADLGRARIVRVARSLGAVPDDAPKEERLPAAFKSFILAPSNFRQWRGDGVESESELSAQIALFADSVKPDAKAIDLLYEVLLTRGVELATPVRRIAIEGAEVFVVEEEKIAIVLDTFNLSMIEPLLGLRPREIIALDRVFSGLDTVKANFELQCRDASVKLTCM